MKGSKFVAQMGLDPIKYVAFDNTGSDTEQLYPCDRIVRASGALGAGTLYLPPVSEAIPLVPYLIKATSVAKGNVTVAPFQGGQATADSVLRENEGTLGGSTSTSLAITGANGWLILMSDGLDWFVVADDLDAA